MAFSAATNSSPRAERSPPSRDPAASRESMKHFIAGSSCLHLWLLGVTRALAWCFALAGLASLNTLAADKPNLLHINADDHRPDGLHALGNKVLQTPNLDTLVASGMTFTHCCTMGSMVGAVCQPMVRLPGVDGPSATFSNSGYRPTPCPFAKCAARGLSAALRGHDCGSESPKTR